MDVSVYARAWSEALSQWGDLVFGLIGISLGLAIAQVVAREMTKALRAYFEPEKQKDKPKRTGEKLKRSDGAVLDVITEKRKNDEITQ